MHAPIRSKAVQTPAPRPKIVFEKRTSGADIGTARPRDLIVTQSVISLTGAAFYLGNVGSYCFWGASRHNTKMVVRGDKAIDNIHQEKGLYPRSRAIRQTTAKSMIESHAANTVNADSTNNIYKLNSDLWLQFSFRVAKIQKTGCREKDFQQSLELGRI